MGYLQKFTQWDQAQDAPSSSFIIVTDVKGSTQAVQEGRYRDVNLVGAASIAAIRNEFPDLSLPYVFGGDGATFLVPQDQLNRCREVLCSVQKIARTQMGMDLRVGHISVKEVLEKGGSLRVGFVPIQGKEGFFFFRGNGIALAEQIIKSRENFFCDPESTQIERANLDGLSCRVQPFSPIRGKIACILIEPRKQGPEQDQLIHRILDSLAQGGSIDHLSPLSLQNAKRKWIPSTWKQEASLLSAGRNFAVTSAIYFWTVLNTLIGNVLFLFDLRNPFIGKPRDYSRDMIAQADWVKMDGSLKMVLDLTSDELNQISTLLEKLHAQGEIFYGIHSCDSAVMTCHLMTSVAYQPQHTHFIDGSEGGLTAAAVRLKKQKLNSI